MCHNQAVLAVLDMAAAFDIVTFCYSAWNDHADRVTGKALAWFTCPADIILSGLEISSLQAVMCLTAFQKDPSLDHSCLSYT